MIACELLKRMRQLDRPLSYPVRKAGWSWGLCGACLICATNPSDIGMFQSEQGCTVLWYLLSMRESAKQRVALQNRPAEFAK